MIDLKAIKELRLNDEKAKIFGFIMFTNSHSNIVNVLQNDNHWKAFDEDSEGWIIHSIRPKEGKVEFPSSNGNISHMMVPIWKEPNENKKMLELFQLESTKELPCFIAFIIKDDDSIHRIVYPLDDKNYEKARNSLKEIILEITATVDKILPEYKVSESVYREVKKTVESKIVWNKLKKTVRLSAWLKSLL